MSNFSKEKKVAAFKVLGDFLLNIDDQLDNLISGAKHKNGWFQETEVKRAFLANGHMLNEADLNYWINKYPTALKPKKIGLILAGNIPLVGFHDILSVLISGNIALIKLSSNDDLLIPTVLKKLVEIEPEFIKQIKWVSKLEDFDAVIATGSNNTNRYFEYYFKNKSSLLRKSRTSVAVLTGKETQEDLHKLGEDIFTYFGLGCRNVSKIYLPEGYDIATFYEGIVDFYEHINHNKYANNYTYHKAIFLMNLTQHFDNNFLLLKEDKAIASPLGVLFYEYYSDINELAQTLALQKENIQCVVSKVAINDSLPLGKAQQPELTDYADGVDTVKFLMEI